MCIQFYLLLWNIFIPREEYRLKVYENGLLRIISGLGGGGTSKSWEKTA
jgi:hypothetical protein